MRQHAKEVCEQIHSLRAPSQPNQLKLSLIFAFGHQVNQSSATFSDLWTTRLAYYSVIYWLTGSLKDKWHTEVLLKGTPLTGITVFASILICLKRLYYWHHLDGLLYYWSTGHNFFIGGHMAELSERWTRNLSSRGLFVESPSNFSGQEGCFVFVVFAFKTNNFENNTTKLSADEAKLTGLWGRNCATICTIQQNLKFGWGPEKLSGLSRNGPRVQVPP